MGVSSNLLQFLLPKTGNLPGGKITLVRLISNFELM